MMVTNRRARAVRVRSRPPVCTSSRSYHMNAPNNTTPHKKMEENQSVMRRESDKLFSLAHELPHHVADAACRVKKLGLAYFRAQSSNKDVQRTFVRLCSESPTSFDQRVSGNDRSRAA